MKRFATASGASPVLHRNSANLMQSMLDEVKANITILPDLQALIPPLQAGEYQQLEANIRQDGCRESLLIWQTTQGVIDQSDNDLPINVLIDGHNRYSICINHAIDFKIMLREFPTLQVVRDFMIDNQLGRRNLTPEQTSYLRGLKYRNERQSTGRPVQDGTIEGQKQAEAKLAQRTQDRLAKEFNVSPRTIHRDREYSEGIDRLTPELKQDVLTGKQKVAKEVIRSVGRTSSVDVSPLSLPDLLSFSELASHDNFDDPTPDATTDIAGTLSELTDTVTRLDPDHSNFDADCEHIISLVQKVKKQQKLQNQSRKD